MAFARFKGAIVFALLAEQASATRCDEGMVCSGFQEDDSAMLQVSKRDDPTVDAGRKLQEAHAAVGQLVADFDRQLGYNATSAEHAQTKGPLRQNSSLQSSKTMREHTEMLHQQHLPDAAIQPVSPSNNYGTSSFQGEEHIDVGTHARYAVGNQMKVDDPPRVSKANSSDKSTSHSHSEQTIPPRPYSVSDSEMKKQHKNASIQDASAIAAGVPTRVGRSQIQTTLGTLREAREAAETRSDGKTSSSAEAGATTTAVPVVSTRIPDKTQHDAAVSNKERLPNMRMVLGDMNRLSAAMEKLSDQEDLASNTRVANHTEGHPQDADLRVHSGSALRRQPVSSPLPNATKSTEQRIKADDRAHYTREARNGEVEMLKGNENGHVHNTQQWHERMNFSSKQANAPGAMSSAVYSGQGHGGTEGAAKEGHRDAKVEPSVESVAHGSTQTASYSLPKKASAPTLDVYAKEQNSTGRAPRNSGRAVDVKAEQLMEPAMHDAPRALSSSFIPKNSNVASSYAHGGSENSTSATAKNYARAASPPPVGHSSPHESASNSHLDTTNHTERHPQEAGFRGHAHTAMRGQPRATPSFNATKSTEQRTRTDDRFAHSHHGPPAYSATRSNENDWSKTSEYAHERNTQRAHEPNYSRQNRPTDDLYPAESVGTRTRFGTEGAGREDHHHATVEPSMEANAHEGAVGSYYSMSKNIANYYTHGGSQNGTFNVPRNSGRSAYAPTAGHLSPHEVHPHEAASNSHMDAANHTGRHPQEAGFRGHSGQYAQGWAEQRMRSEDRDVHDRSMRQVLEKSNSSSRHSWSGHWENENVAREGHRDARTHDYPPATYSSYLPRKTGAVASDMHTQAQNSSVHPAGHSGRKVDTQMPVHSNQHDVASNSHLQTVPQEAGFRGHPGQAIQGLGANPSFNATKSADPRIKRDDRVASLHHDAVAHTATRNIGGDFPTAGRNTNGRNIQQVHERYNSSSRPSRVSEDAATDRNLHGHWESENVAREIRHDAKVEPSIEANAHEGAPAVSYSSTSKNGNAANYYTHGGSQNGTFTVSRNSGRAASAPTAGHSSPHEAVSNSHLDTTNHTEGHPQEAGFRAHSGQVAQGLPRASASSFNATRSAEQRIKPDVGAHVTRNGESDSMKTVDYASHNAQKVHERPDYYSKQNTLSGESYTEQPATSFPSSGSTVTDRSGSVETDNMARDLHRDATIEPLTGSSIHEGAQIATPSSVPKKADQPVEVLTVEILPAPAYSTTSSYQMETVDLGASLDVSRKVDDKSALEGKSATADAHEPEVRLSRVEPTTTAQPVPITGTIAGKV